jgi:TfoX/Sxy family transcriptional regulator of competence genes
MACNEQLAQRLRLAMGGLPGVSEKKMFGGVAFLVNGNMSCGVHKDDLIVRVGVENYQKALNRSHAHPFDMTGRPMTGWVSVSTEGYQQEADLDYWIGKGMDFAGSLPAK